MSREGNLGRSSLLFTVAAAIGVLLAATLVSFVVPRPAIGSASGSASANDPIQVSAAVSAWFGDVARHQRLGAARLVRLQRVDDGALRVELESNGELVRFDVLARDPDGVPGIASSTAASLYLVGSPSAQTPEMHVHLAEALAKVLADSEARGIAAPQLPTMRQRH